MGPDYGGFAWFVIWTAFNMHVESLKGFKKRSKGIGFAILKNPCGSYRKKKQDS